MIQSITDARMTVVILERKRSAMIRRAVHKLRDRGFSYREIADVLGISEERVFFANKEREEYEEHLKKIGG